MRSDKDGTVLTQQVVVGVPFVFEGEPAVRYVVDVFEPFEKWYSHTTGVHVQIGNDEDILLKEDGVGGRGQRSVGSLGDDLGLDFVGVVFIDHFLGGGRHENIYFVEQQVAVVRFGSGESHDGAVVHAVVFQFLQQAYFNYGTNERILTPTLGSIPFSLKMEPSYSMTPMHLAPTLCK